MIFTLGKLHCPRCGKEFLIVNYPTLHGNKIIRINKHGKKVISGNPYDSAIYGYNVFPDRFIEAFGKLGKILEVSCA